VQVTAIGGARRRAHRCKVDLDRHYTIRHTGYTKTTRTTHASDLEHQDGWSGNSDGVQPDEADDRGGGNSSECARSKQSART
jgi:hypothetical protein